MNCNARHQFLPNEVNLNRDEPNTAIFAKRPRFETEIRVVISEAQMPAKAFNGHVRELVSTSTAHAGKLDSS